MENNLTSNHQVLQPLIVQSTLKVSDVFTESVQSEPENRAANVSFDERGKFAPGNCANPLGRPKSSKIVSDAIKQALAEGKAEDVKDKLFGLMDEADRDSVRLAAISEIMDRSEGKAVQNVRHAGVFMVLAPGEDVLAAAFGGSAPDESE